MVANGELGVGGMNSESITVALSPNAIPFFPPAIAYVSNETMQTVSSDNLNFSEGGDATASVALAPIVLEAEPPKSDIRDVGSSISSKLIEVPVNLIDTQAMANCLGESSGLDVRNQLNWLNVSSDGDSENELSEGGLASPDACGVCRGLVDPCTVQASCRRLEVHTCLSDWLACNCLSALRFLGTPGIATPCNAAFPGSEEHSDSYKLTNQISICGLLQLLASPASCRSNMTRRERPRFQDVGGINLILVDLMKPIIPFFHLDVHKRLGVRPTGGILLHGPPGCGKTMLAYAIANESVLSFHKISATEVVSGV
ncbi:Cell division control protein 48 like C [Dendrobium catenatum]|uniref:Cell division control protein 48 like C n=1 Tax=Dendrobium catenatum TaxID=906689 RepID=A0A2I0VM34_9ASPA|nr:Cell division control protein 48 like C [Dendrobium catenatum]